MFPAAGTGPAQLPKSVGLTKEMIITMCVFKETENNGKKRTSNKNFKRLPKSVVRGAFAPDSCCRERIQGQSQWLNEKGRNSKMNKIKQES